MRSFHTSTWRSLPTPSRRRYLVLATLLALASLVAWPFSAAPASAATAAASAITWYVAADGGNDANDCASITSACRTIGAAITKAGNGDTVSIGGGTYAERLSIDKDITLINRRSVVAVDGEGAGRVFTIASGANVVMFGLIIRNGSVSGPGGGILNEGDLSLHGVSVTGNSATSGGGISNSGTLGVYSSGITANRAIGAGENHGGGIENTGTLSLVYSDVENNASNGLGGGVYSCNALTIVDTSLAKNSAAAGGGLFDCGRTTIASSTFNDNTADYFGGAIDNSGIITLTNSTLSRNRATGATGLGGGIWNDSGDMKVFNSTIVANTAVTGGGIAFKTRSFSIANTILAGNAASNGPDCSDEQAAPGLLASLGYNLIGDVSRCGIAAAVGDLVGTAAAPLDPKLSPLQDNGGLTLTHKPLPGSPAIDAGGPAAPSSDPAACAAADQRSTLRPQGGRCDIGAYETGVITWYADAPPLGGFGNSCQSAALPCGSISGAIVKATSGETIRIAPGTYAEGISFIENLTLVGQGAQPTDVMIDGNQGGRPVNSNSPTRTTIANLTIQGGLADVPNHSSGGGGGIYNSGTLTLTDVIVRDNADGYFAGAIFNSGVMTLNRVQVLDNKVTPFDNLVGNRNGGGIVNYGQLTATDSLIQGNSADLGTLFGPVVDSVGGGIFNNDGARMTLVRTRVLSNTTTTLPGGRTAEGAGIQNYGDLTLIASVVSGNTARGRSAVGGGLYNVGGATANLIDSDVTGNLAVSNGSASEDAVRGGGIRNEGSLTLRGVNVNGNTTQSPIDARWGGGIFNSGLISATNSLFANNVANQGAGIYSVANASLQLANSTFSGNKAVAGGALYIISGTHTLDSLTITQNSADDTGGGVLVADQRASVRLHNTLLAGNNAPSQPDCSGPLFSAGYNLIGVVDGCTFARTPGDKLGSAASHLNPQVGPLANNGGRTLTRSLLPRSPAIDAGDPAACPATDQRSVVRPLDGDGDGAPACDIGAFEAAYTVADSGVRFPADIPSIPNPGGAAQYSDYRAVFGEPTVTKVTTATNTAAITATDRLDLPFGLTKEDIRASLPISIELSPDGRPIALPNLNALWYETTVISATFADANIDRADGALKAGLCVGLTTTTANFWAGLDQMPYGGPPVNAIPLSDNVRALLQQNHMRQLSAESLAYLADKGRHDDVKAYFDALTARIHDEQAWKANSEIIGIVNHEGDPSQSCADTEIGHALWPYRTVVSADQQLYRIYVYDPNYPATASGTADDHSIELVKFGNAWRWSYEIAPAANGKAPVIWSGTTLYNLPLNVLLTKASLPTEDDQGVLLVNGGQRSVLGGKHGAWGGKHGAWGELNGSVVGCLPDASGALSFTRQISRSLRLFSLANTALYLPADQVQSSGGLTFHSRGGEVSDMLVFGRHTVIGYLGTVGDQLNAEDQLTVDPMLQSVALRTSEQQAGKQITIYQMHEGEPGENGVSETRVVAVSNTGLSGGETLTVSVSKDERGNVTGMTVVNTSGVTKTADIGLASVGAAGVSTVVYNGQSIEPGSRYTFKPQQEEGWHDLAHAPVLVEIDTNNDGQPEQRVVLQPPPTSQVLDSFSRGSGALGSAWAGHTGADEYKIVGQQAQVRDGGLLYWRANEFGATQEAFATLQRVGPQEGRTGLLLKVQGDAPNVRNGAIEARYYPKNHFIRIFVREPRKPWRVVATIPATFADGDTFRARALSNGQVQVYRNATLLGEANAGAYFANRGGRIGLRYLDARGAKFDDFGGGIAP